MLAHNYHGLDMPLVKQPKEITRLGVVGVALFLVLLFKLTYLVRSIRFPLTQTSSATSEQGQGKERKKHHGKDGQDRL